MKKSFCMVEIETDRGKLFIRSDRIDAIVYPDPEQFEIQCAGNRYQIRVSLRLANQWSENANCTPNESAAHINHRRVYVLNRIAAGSWGQEVDTSPIGIQIHY